MNTHGLSDISVCENYNITYKYVSVTSRVNMDEAEDQGRDVSPEGQGSDGTQEAESSGMSDGTTAAIAIGAVLGVMAVIVLGAFVSQKLGQRRALEESGSRRTSTIVHAEEYGGSQQVMNPVHLGTQYSYARSAFAQPASGYA